MNRKSSKVYTLTTLPLSILTRILRYLCPHNPFDRTNRLAAPFWLPFRDPRVTHSLLCARALKVQLPNELLPPALASPVLAAAAANILGDRVSFLTHSNTGGQLSAWIHAFAPYVKAVSHEDLIPTWLDGRKTAQIGASPFRKQLTAQRKNTAHLFKTLLVHTIMLEVLDLQDVHFSNFKILEDEMLAGLCATLESSSGTLRELALPAFPTSDICDKALQMSQLKRLEVLSVKACAKIHVIDSESLPPPIVRMIRAVDGHADRSRKLTTLRELRLWNVEFDSYHHLTASDRKSPVFLSVKTLRTFWNPDEELGDYDYRFVSLFKNLERLFWNVFPGSSNRLFAKICTKVSEIHLCDSRWTAAPIEVGAEEHYEVPWHFFRERSCDGNYGAGAIISVYAGAMSGIDVRRMMMYCPRLENLSVHIRRDNIRAIRKLVAKCQQMECLELVYGDREGGRLGAEDWHAISRIIPKSHKNLCQVAIQTMDFNSWYTTRTEAVFGCFEKVAKTLGDRARRLAFRALFERREGAQIMERVCELLKVCIEHTPRLESFEIRPRRTKDDTSGYDRGWTKGVARRMIETESRMLQEIPSLRMVDIGVWPRLLQQIDLIDDSLNTDSMGSETEWTGSWSQTT